MSEDVVKQRTLQDCEADIDKATVFIRGGFYIAGQRFGEIKERELWKKAATFSGTYDAYCRGRWSMAARSADRLIAASVVVNNLCTDSDQLVLDCPQLPKTLPQNESIARVLSRREVEQQPLVWGKVLADYPKPENRTAAATKKIDRELYPPIPDAGEDLRVAPKIYHTSAVKLLKRITKPLPLLITDPPYITEFNDSYDEYLGFTETWLLPAAEKISDTGWMMVFSGAYPDEMRVYLDVFAKTDLILGPPFIWTYNNTIGPSGDETLVRNYQIGWLAGRAESKLRGDIKQKWASQTINAPDGRQGDRFYKWQKPDALANTLVGVLSHDGDEVVDPFAGSGAFLLAAGRRGQPSFGCDTEESCVDLCVQRGCFRG